MGELMRATMRYITTSEAYENPGAWRRVEEGLAIRSTKLPALKTCYVEKNVSDYVHWGCNVIDFERVLPEFCYGFVHFDLAQMEAQIIDTKQGSNNGISFEGDRHTGGFVFVHLS